MEAPKVPSFPGLPGQHLVKHGRLPPSMFKHNGDFNLSRLTARNWVRLFRMAKMSVVATPELQFIVSLTLTMATDARYVHFPGPCPGTLDGVVCDESGPRERNGCVRFRGPMGTNLYRTNQVQRLDSMTGVEALHLCPHPHLHSHCRLSLHRRCDGHPNGRLHRRHEHQHARARPDNCARTDGPHEKGMEERGASVHEDSYLTDTHSHF